MQAAGEHVREDMLRKQLWVDENWDSFREKQQDEMKAKMAESTRYKMYRYDS